MSLYGICCIEEKFYLPGVIDGQFCLCTSTDGDHGELPIATSPTPLSQHISEQHLPTLSLTLYIGAFI